MFLLRRLDLALADTRSNSGVLCCTARKKDKRLGVLPGSDGLTNRFATVQDGNGVEKHSLYKE